MRSNQVMRGVGESLLHQFDHGIQYRMLVVHKTEHIGHIAHGVGRAAHNPTLGRAAAAATAVIMKLTAMPVEPIEVIVDRPFIFLIRDIETGTILFVGRILNPGS